MKLSIKRRSNGATPGPAIKGRTEGLGKGGMQLGNPRAQSTPAGLNTDALGGTGIREGLQAPNRLLTRTEVAAWLGVKPHTLAVWKATNRYAVPTVKVGTKSMYKSEDIAAFITARTVGGA